jgi:hypothetical protein
MKDLQSFPAIVPLAARIFLVRTHFDYAVRFNQHLEAAVLRTTNTGCLFPHLILRHAEIFEEFPGRDPARNAGQKVPPRTPPQKLLSMRLLPPARDDVRLDKGFLAGHLTLLEKSLSLIWFYSSSNHWQILLYTKFPSKKNQSRITLRSLLSRTFSSKVKFLRSSSLALSLSSMSLGSSSLASSVK